MADTELTLVSGDRYTVEGSVDDVAAKIIDAARGSILQLARFVEPSSGRELVVNPHHVVALRDAADLA